MDSPSDALRERLSDCERDCDNERNWLWLRLFDIERSMLSERDLDHERSAMDSLFDNDFDNETERDFDHERSTIDSLLLRLRESERDRDMLSDCERDSDALPLFDLPDHDCDFD